MTAFLLTLIKRMGTYFLTESFGFWVAAKLAAQTDNLIDDNAVALLKALVKGDADAAVTAGKALIESIEATLAAKESAQ